MPALVDTTVRLLSQEPLAARVPASRIVEVARVLDTAGFAALEVSGGGCFDSAVRRGVESPWERIRTLRAECETPLQMALRGRFLVGSRPLEGDLVRRFVESAASNGIDRFRLHDPLNDLSNLKEAADAINAAGKELAIGLVHTPGPEDALDVLLQRSNELSELGAARVLIHDASGSLSPGHVRELVEGIGAASGLPVGLHAQGAGGTALAAAIEAARAGAETIACAVYPLAVTLHRASAETITQHLGEMGIDTGTKLDTLWEASELVDEALGDDPVLPVSPRVAVRAAEHHLPTGLVAELEASLRRQGSSDRLDAVLDELRVIRGELGWPPLAAPIGQMLGSQALIHVLSAQRWQIFVDELPELIEGEYGATPGAIDPAVKRAADLLVTDTADEEPLELEEIRAALEGIAASEEELLLVALFGEEAEPLLHAIRARGGREDRSSGLERDESERLRDLIGIVQESGIGELTLEEGEWRVTVRRTGEQVPVAAAAAPATAPGPDEAAVLQPPAAPPDAGTIRVESPMVGTFYRAPAPGEPPFVEVGDTVEPGQTLCILEAMKLMNEVKAEHLARVRTISVENEHAVEYGDLLFELEPLNDRPPDAA
jgi:oxaloacetate decarboxylase (Na+ extruding) subunit alpha